MGFIGVVCSIAVFTQPDESLHDSLFVQHVPLFHHGGGCQDSSQRVVVRCRDGVKLVVMATGTAKGLTEHCAANGVDLLVSNIQSLFLSIDTEQYFRADDEKAGGNSLTISLVDGVVGKQIACQLFEQKPVKRHVRIDGVDHPVPVAPGFTEKKVFIEAVRIGVARQIQPMPPPAPAEFW